jgi:hypothetical protein
VVAVDCRSISAAPEDGEKGVEGDEVIDCGVSRVDEPQNK